MERQNYKVSLILVTLLLISFVAVRFAYKGWRKSGVTKKESVITRSNLERSSYGVPLIEKNWIVHRNDSFHIYWSNRNRMVSGTEPYHLYKDITLEKGMPWIEKDAFHYEMSDTLSFRLISKYDWVEKTFEYELVKYRSADVDPVSSIRITKSAFDSALRVWGIPESPH